MKVTIYWDEGTNYVCPWKDGDDEHLKEWGGHAPIEVDDTAYAMYEAAEKAFLTIQQAFIKKYGMSKWQQPESWEPPQPESQEAQQAWAEYLDDSTKPIVAIDLELEALLAEEEEIERRTQLATAGVLPPKYVHDCNECIYLGTETILTAYHHEGNHVAPVTYDLYWHETYNEGIAVARYGNSGFQCSTGPTGVLKVEALERARALAVERGLTPAS